MTQCVEHVDVLSAARTRNLRLSTKTDLNGTESSPPLVQWRMAETLASLGYLRIEDVKKSNRHRRRVQVVHEDGTEGEAILKGGDFERWAVITEAGRVFLDRVGTDREKAKETIEKAKTETPVPIPTSRSQYDRMSNAAWQRLVVQLGCEQQKGESRNVHIDRVWDACVVALRPSSQPQPKTTEQTSEPIAPKETTVTETQTTSEPTPSACPVCGNDPTQCGCETDEVKTTEPNGKEDVLARPLPTDRAQLVAAIVMRVSILASRIAALGELSDDERDTLAAVVESLCEEVDCHQVVPLPADHPALGGDGYDPDLTAEQEAARGLPPAPNAPVVKPEEPRFEAGDWVRVQQQLVVNPDPRFQGAVGKVAKVVRCDDDIGLLYRVKLNDGTDCLFSADELVVATKPVAPRPVAPPSSKPTATVVIPSDDELNGMQKWELHNLVVSLGIRPLMGAGKGTLIHQIREARRSR